MLCYALLCSGGQGLYVSESSDVEVEGLIVRNSWWWNTEVEHTTRLTLKSYKALQDPQFSFYQARRSSPRLSSPPLLPASPHHSLRAPERRRQL